MEKAAKKLLRLLLLGSSARFAEANLDQHRATEKRLDEAGLRGCKGMGASLVFFCFLFCFLFRGDPLLLVGWLVGWLVG